MFTRPTPTCCLGLFLLAAVAPRTLAQCDHSKLLADDRASTDLFGYAISMSQIPAGSAPSMLIGAWSDDTADGASAGSAYVFHRGVNGWTQSEQIFASDGQPSDFFGTSVGYDFPWAAVGATGVSNTGAAYVYYYVGSGPIPWWEIAKLLPSNSQSGDDVGRSVDITTDHGGWAIVGAPLRDFDFDPSPGASDADAGAAYLFRFESGTYVQNASMPFRLAILGGGGAWNGDRFGYAVAIEGDVAIGGAPFAEELPGRTDHGAIEVARYDPGADSFGIGQTIVPATLSTDDHFGMAVATDGLSIAIGAPDDDLASGEMPGITAKSNSGCIYIYRWTNNAWAFDGRVFASDPTDDARLGNSVAIEGDSLVAAAPGARQAYLFKRVGASDWIQIGRYSDPDNSADGGFGGRVAIAAGEIGVGDSGDDHASPSPGTSNQGAAYTFAIPDESVGSDHCELATVIPGHGEYTGCTSAATLAGSTTCGAGGIGGFGPDVWYSWTPACSGNIIIDTFGSDFDTVLSVHTACPGTAANTVICGDDSNFGLISVITFNYTAGQTYLIRISGFSRDSGNYTLRINDWYTPANDTCASAQNISNGTISFTTCKATSTYLGPACGIGADMQKDVWFRYTASCSGAVRVNTCGSTFDTMLQVFPANACPVLNQVPLRCSDDVPAAECPANPDSSATSFPTTAGQVYYLRIGGRPSAPLGQSGDGVLTITCNACPCDWNLNSTLSVQDIFDFLASYFAGAGDFNASGTTSVQDIFDFLACYFAGCL